MMAIHFIKDLARNLGWPTNAVLLDARTVWMRMSVLPADLDLIYKMEHAQPNVISHPAGNAITLYVKSAKMATPS